MLVEERITFGGLYLSQPDIEITLAHQVNAA